MNGGYEEVLLRAVDEIADAVKPWLSPSVEAEVRRQLNGDDPNKPGAAPSRPQRCNVGLQLSITGCGLKPAAKIRLALDAADAVRDALFDTLKVLVTTEISKQQPISQRAQKEFDEWAAATRERSARYSRLARLRATGRKLSAGATSS